ncbi:uncharacterized protein DSM5745_10903 [Aspergillus mulundensis]|uniref:Uncharacterized protein n=1 Tax=Aspergillus mulundensis TaxID=1810919 RepID=A0A3D8QF46_9EURO|nr:hypothetical protein DSM5745_10903 [Aspergillus mulundensis]RDW60445.1 hypothetical protein DSM5745_10903 [Aspergillus mulundensis]
MASDAAGAPTPGLTRRVAPSNLLSRIMFTSSAPLLATHVAAPAVASADWFLKAADNDRLLTLVVVLRLLQIPWLPANALACPACGKPLLTLPLRRDCIPLAF